MGEKGKRKKGISYVAVVFLGLGSLSSRSHTESNHILSVDAVPKKTLSVICTVLRDDLTEAASKFWTPCAKRQAHSSAGLRNYLASLVYLTKRHFHMSNRLAVKSINGKVAGDE